MIPAAPGSAPGIKDPKSTCGDKGPPAYNGFFDSFSKVKAARIALSPSSAAFNNDNQQPDSSAHPSPAYSPIPPPMGTAPCDMKGSKRNTKQYGYYEYQTPSHQTRIETTTTPGTPRTPNGERMAQDDGHSVPRDEKYDGTEEDGQAEEEQEPKTRKERWNNFMSRKRRWLASQFQRPKSRIPSLQVDVEAQALEAMEREIREAYVLSWTTVAGAWIVQFTTFGYIWSFGVFQDFYLNTYPEVHKSAPKVAWIGSLQLMMTFALALVSGKLFDAGWFHAVMMLGSLIFGMGTFVLSFVDPTKYFPLFLTQGLFMGLGVGLVFLPSILIVHLHFPERKGLMTGIVMSGSSFGSLLYPVMLDKLLPTKGFHGAVRATSYMIVCLLVIANCLMAAPPKKWQPKFPAVNVIAYMKEIHYAAACGGIFLVFLSMWFPQYYIEEFATRHGVNPHLAFYSLALIALGGMAGRPAMGFAADRFGPWTMLLPTTFVLMLMVCMVALLKNAGGVVMVSMIYGFASGAWLSLLITALAALAIRPGELGHRVGMALSVGSMGSFLTGSAQAGLLSDKYLWARPIGLFTFLLVLSAGIFGYVRYLISVKRRFAYV